MRLRLPAAVSLLWIGTTAACTPECPEGYTQMGDTCYRRRDGGVLEAGSGAVEGNDDGGDESEDGRGDTSTASPSGNSEHDAAGPTVDAARDAYVTDEIDGAKEAAAPLESGTQQDSGRVADADTACGDCGTAPTCKVRACNGTVCVESNMDRGTACTRASTAGVCDGNGSCVECNGDPDCAGSVGGVDACHEAACIDKTCATRVKPWARCGASSVCDSEGKCAAACGNRHFDPEFEECDPSVDSDSWRCNRSTCRLTGLSAATSYHRCSGPSDCASGETCKASGILIGFVACIPTCTAPPARACPIPPGFTSWILGDELSCDNQTRDCFVKCTNDMNCPPGVPCTSGVCYDPS